MAEANAPALIPWTDTMANSSRTRAAIRSILGNHTSDDDHADMVDRIIRVISDKVNSGSEHSPVTAALLQTLYGILICCGIATNLFVWFVFVRKPKLRTTRNMFIVNLCTSDILLCTITMPFTLMFLLEAKWTLGLHLCKLVPTIQCSSILVSTGTVIIIALDRYNAIVRTPCASFGPLALAISSPIWFFNRTEPLPFPSWPGQSPVFSLYEICMEDWPNQASRLVFTVVILLTQYLVPIVTLSATHSRITRFLHDHMSTGNIQSRIRAELLRNRRVTLVLVLIVVVFAVSWLPFHLFVMLDELHYIDVKTRSYSLGFAVCHLLAMTTAISNPILYGLLNTNFQREWLQLVPVVFKRRVGAPDSSPRSEGRRPTRSQPVALPLVTLLRPEAISSTAVSQLASERPSHRAQVTQL
ncbi:neuropeptide F receptor-like [Pollicipes pollicipes]|uniref:neuropeptide F receptor-like n=1 Tax=Pollicipes pollicipes TaxID=41117 RepID=UPI001884B1B8|nr:neuropeptide F receptor-like [Pollicipes pollicipes]